MSQSQQKPPFAADAVELCRKLDHLISVLEKRVEKARRDGVPLDPPVRECVWAVSDLRAKTLEFEVSLDLLSSATKLVKELLHLLPRIKRVAEKAGGDDALRRGVDEFLYEAMVFAEMIRDMVHDREDQPA